MQYSTPDPILDLTSNLISYDLILDLKSDLMSYLPSDPILEMIPGPTSDQLLDLISGPISDQI